MNHPQPPDSDNLQWRRSIYSNAGNECVEVARTPAGYLVRDSKNPDGPWLSFSPSKWDALIRDIKCGKCA